MNIHIELQRLKEEYGNDPATKPAYMAMVRLFSAFIEEITESLTKMKRNN